MADWEYVTCPQCDGFGVGGWESRPCSHPGCHKRMGGYVVAVPAAHAQPEPAGAPRAPRPAKAPGAPRRPMSAAERRIALLWLCLAGWVVALVLMGRLALVAVPAMIAVSLIRLPHTPGRLLAGAALGLASLGTFSLYVLVRGAPRFLGGRMG